MSTKSVELATGNGGLPLVKNPHAVEHGRNLFERRTYHGLSKKQ
ncbi:MAG: hypothetical protein WDM76_07455 [Limisphaerales bacterium]